MAEHLAQLRFTALDLALLAPRGFPAVLPAIPRELDPVALDFGAKPNDGVVVAAAIVVSPAVVIVRERKRRDRERSKGDTEDGDFLETEHD
jgi:hypothetical protein